MAACLLALSHYQIASYAAPLCAQGVHYNLNGDHNPYYLDRRGPLVSVFFGLSFTSCKII